MADTTHDQVADALGGASRPIRPQGNGTKGAPAPAIPVEPDEVNRAGDEFTFLFRGLGIGVAVDQLRESSDGLHGELTVQCSAVSEPLLSSGRTNLGSLTQRRTLAKELSELHPGASWRALLERVSRETITRFRAGSVVQRLQPVTGNPVQFLLDPLVQTGAVNILFGPGGTGKSLVALGLAVAVGSSIPLPRVRPTEPARTLYLDYEDDINVHQERLGGVLAGFDRTDPPPIFYRRMHRPISEDTARLRSEIAKHAASLVIVDSLVPATGFRDGHGPESASAASAVMTALRSLAVTVLAIGHTTKTDSARQDGASRIFGSTFYENLSRRAIELRATETADDGEEALRLGFYLRKHNAGRSFAPFGWRITFDGPTIRFHGQDLAEEPDLLARTSLQHRLLQALRAGEQTVDQLAEAAETSAEAARKTLSRLRIQGKVVRLDEARGRKNVWGLKA